MQIGYTDQKVCGIGPFSCGQAVCNQGMQLPNPGGAETETAKQDAAPKLLAKMR